MTNRRFDQRCKGALTKQDRVNGHSCVAWSPFSASRRPGAAARAFSNSARPSVRRPWRSRNAPNTSCAGWSIVGGPKATGTPASSATARRSSFSAVGRSFSCSAITPFASSSRISGRMRLVGSESLRFVYKATTAWDMVSSLTMASRAPALFLRPISLSTPANAKSSCAPGPPLAGTVQPATSPLQSSVSSR
jgi:hypothetical protein